MIETQGSHHYQQQQHYDQCLHYLQTLVALEEWAFEFGAVAVAAVAVMVVVVVDGYVVDPLTIKVNILFFLA